MPYDVLLIHPPATYDFRKKAVFPGPISRTLGESTDEFVVIPFGMVSIADYLDRNGYKVIVDNLGYRMVNGNNFDVERHIRNISAKVYAIGLHWSVHSQGAIALAKICKELHPESAVVLGGLTASIFHDEIVRKFGFVDAVIRGEAERPLLQFMQTLDKGKIFGETGSLTYRNDSGIVTTTPLMKPSSDLDDFNFTRLDLLEPRASAFPSGFLHWKIPVCRGCIYDCVVCGGSAYSYRTYFGMERLSLRSPAKIVEDMRSVIDQGVRFIGLSQDPRMGGRKYWEELAASLSREDLNVERLAIDLHTPADEEFVKAVSKTGKRTVLAISPESGSYEVRKFDGRNHTNVNYMDTARLCCKYGIPITFFFMVGLAKETNETFKETCKMWQDLVLLDQKARFEGRFGNLERHFPITGPVMSQMILLDPGSLAFDFPEKYGYHLTIRNFEEYVENLSNPSWHMWINYETEQLDREELAHLFLQSIEYEISQREKYGAYNSGQAALERFQVRAQRFAMEEVRSIMRSADQAGELKLESLRKALRAYSSGMEPPSDSDPYSYMRRMSELAHPFMGLNEGGERKFSFTPV